jgi:hypothetical protein
MSFSGISAIIVLLIILAIPIAIVTTVLGLTSRFTQRKKQLFQNVIIAEYDPPANLSPAEIGYLFDSRLDNTEVNATLVSLEQRGLVSFSFSTLDGLHIEKNITHMPTNLKPHELFLLDSLKAKSNLSLYSSKIMTGFTESVNKALLTQGYVKPSRANYGYFGQRTLIAYVLFTVPLFFWFIYGAKDIVGAVIFGFILIFLVGFPVFMILAPLAGFIYGKIVGTPGLWTDKVKSIWNEIEGYRDFVEQVELDQLQYESEDLKIRSKNKALPYAIALGLNTEWEKRYL